MTEKQFQNKVIKWFKKKGIWYCNVWGGGYQRAGIPDLLCCYCGRFIALELKSEKGKPSLLQLHHIEQIKKAGGYARVLRPSDWESFKKEVESGEILSQYG